MELRDAIAARRMVRAFEPRPVDPSLIDQLCDLARRAPSAGNTRATSFVVLEGPDQVGRYWDASLPAERRGMLEVLDIEQQVEGNLVFLQDLESANDLGANNEVVVRFVLGDMSDSDELLVRGELFQLLLAVF